MTVPEGYEVNVIYALGDSLNPSFGDWDDNNIPSGPSFQFRSGDCHDGMHYFGLNTLTNRFDDTVSAQGLLVMNHEYINQTFLHPKGPTKVDGRRPEDEVIRETNAHGVSVVHIKRPCYSKVEVVKTLFLIDALQVLQSWTSLVPRQDLTYFRRVFACWSPDSWYTQQLW